MHPKLRKFDSGAFRNAAGNKLDYEACLSPLVLRRYAQYARMTSRLPGGDVRPQDNWQLGFPPAEIMKSLWRHFWHVWFLHRRNGGRALENALCALIFNAQCYLHLLIVKRGGSR